MNAATAGESQAMPDWRRAGGQCRASADMRVTPQDFRVTELLDIEPDGQGEHDWLWIEKTGTNTAWLARRLAEYAGIAARDVGYAGMKDRHAVTRQWFSVRRPGGGGQADWSAFCVPGVSVLETRRHRRKLRTGAHRGNRFDLTLQNVDSDLLPRLETLRRRGVPNYFGEQRFGHDGGNVTLARVLFDGHKLKREKRALALSAARAWLFNTILDDRVSDGSWDQLRAGDIAGLAGSNSVFAVDTPDETLRARCAAFDIHPTGALWGRDSDGTGKCVLAAERAMTEHETALRIGLEQHCEAARRRLRVLPIDLAFEQHETALCLSFDLPGGSYATAVLREVANCRDRAAAAFVQRRRNST